MPEPREERAGTRQHEPVHRTLARPDHERPIREEAGEGRRSRVTESLCSPETTAYVPTFIKASPCSASVVWPGSGWLSINQRSNVLVRRK